jgi:hypothetical protein
MADGQQDPISAARGVKVCRGGPALALLRTKVREGSEPEYPLLDGAAGRALGAAALAVPVIANDRAGDRQQSDGAPGRVGPTVIH